MKPARPEFFKLLFLGGLLLSVFVGGAAISATLLQDAFTAAPTISNLPH